MVRPVEERKRLQTGDREGGADETKQDRYHSTERRDCTDLPAPMRRTRQTGGAAVHRAGVRVDQGEGGMRSI